MAVILSSCHVKEINPNKHLTLEAFSDMRTSCYAIDERLIREDILSMVGSDNVRMSSDRRLHNYYDNAHNPFLWIDRNGVSECADTLLQYLNDSKRTGMDSDIYLVGRLTEDLNRARNLDFTPDDDVNKMLARLEYNLTKAYLRYSSCQCFGFVNPTALLNKFAVKDSDSLKVTYHHLYDVKIHHSDDAFFYKAIRKVMNDSISDFIRDIQPRGTLYHKLLSRLDVTTDSQEREKIICNLERCRWRQDDYPEGHGKYVIVNVPSFNLMAVDNDSIMMMNVCCGARKSMTPLLTSRIARMDINPQWIVPKSIAKGIVHSTGYLQRERMFIYDKKRGRIGYEEASYTKIMDNQQFIIQEGGIGNSLGRIIFRFPNNFSVYLHDTSSPWLLQRPYRAVSHGCVRVEKPFELAKFLIHDKDDELLERIRYSMEAEIGAVDDEKKKNVDRKKLINNVKVEPEVPLYITYYTFFTDKSGKLVEYDDVYGFDKVIIDHLKPYIKR